MGRVMSPRLTCTSTFGPARSKADPSACKPDVARHQNRSGRSKLRRMDTILRSEWARAKRWEWKVGPLERPRPKITLRGRRACPEDGQQEKSLPMTKCEK